MSIWQYTKATQLIDSATRKIPSKKPQNVITSFCWSCRETSNQSTLRGSKTFLSPEGYSSQPIRAMSQKMPWDLTASRPLVVFPLSQHRSNQVAKQPCHPLTWSTRLPGLNNIRGEFHTLREVNWADSSCWWQKIQGAVGGGEVGSIEERTR